MQYEFSWTWFGVGIAVVIVGVLMLRFYNKIADNFLRGPASYNRTKMTALIVTGLGVLMIFNLHTLLIEFVARTLFGGLMQ